MHPTSVTVSVLTYRRNDAVSALLALLRDRLAEGAPDRPAGWDVEVLVVDNAPDADAREVVSAAIDAAAAGTTHGTPTAPVRYVHEPHPGIAAARARVMAEAEANGRALVAFVDDDEEPEAGWLAALLATWQATRAAAVAGRLVPRYPEEIHPWLVTGRFFERRNVPTGTRVEAAPSGNLLLDVGQCARLGIRFNPELGLRGGEDTLFTRQLTAAGGLIVFCRESVVVDPVPANRATIPWVLQRIYSHSSSEADLRARVAGRHEGDVLDIRLGTVGSGLGRIGGGVARLARGVLGGTAFDRANGVRTVVRGAGMLVGALTTPYVEYVRAEPAPVPALAGAGKDDT